MKQLLNNKWKDSIQTPNGTVDIEGTNIDLLIQAIHITPERGVNIAEQHKRFKLIDKLEAVKEQQHFELEDAEFSHLFTIWNEVQYTRLSRPIAELGTHLIEVNNGK